MLYTKLIRKGNTYKTKHLDDSFKWMVRHKACANDGLLSAEDKNPET